jgi:hypothetical protein
MLFVERQYKGLMSDSLLLGKSEMERYRVGRNNVQQYLH